MFPSILNTFNRPAATDRLNSPSHSALHNTVSSALGQVQAVIGTSTTSVLGTIIGDLRNPSSNGGGHVQTAIKGGTGQTTYTKGDVLVASSSSVLSKLAVGLDGQTMVADSSVATGVKWGTAGGTRVYTNASVVTVISTGNETSIFSTTIPGSTLGTANVIRATAYVRYLQGVSDQDFIFRAKYGNNIVSSVRLNSPNTFNSVFGKFEIVLGANAAVNSQRGNFLVDLVGVRTPSIVSTSIFGANTFDTGTSSVESSANQTFGLTAQFSVLAGTGVTGNRIDINMVTVEKIV